MENSEILTHKLESVVSPIMGEISNQMCGECIIDTTIEVIVTSLRQMPIDIRQQFLASIAINFNMETGEINGPIS